jgi:hypothetical protein
MTVNYNQFVRLFGTFFSKYYKELPWYEGLIKSTLSLQEQVEQDLEDMEKSAFRHLVPIYHTKLTHVFDKNESNKDMSPLLYDEPQSYFVEHISEDYWLNAIDKFDNRAVSVQYYRTGLDNVVSIEKIVDRITDPSLVLLPDKDFVIRQGLIEFKTEIPDQRLYLINVKTDESWMYLHFGVLVGLKKDKSSEAYKAIVNTLWDCYNRGGTCSDVFSLIATITGNAIAKSDEAIVSISETVIKTNKNEYPIAQKPCVKVGDSVKAGDNLTDSFDVVEINSLNYSNNMPGVTLKRGILGEGYKGALTFINQLVPVKVKNKRKEFTLFGYPNDEKRFWDGFYENLKENGINPDSVFAAASLYDQINPYRFLVDNALKYHFTFITINNIHYPTEITLSDIGIQKFIPPWNGLIIQISANLFGNITLAADERDTVKINKIHELKGTYSPLFAIKGYLHRI